ncbi:hypothetical protein IAR55_000398 [Kwoniella newhampshirensis]|uniref:mRNA 3'-end-processing protein RNA14 n=1 Tax=Kwoniella newhampshirensis TaxID=1651941 RepID=A0AAW0Z6L7_9TREE
MSASDPSSSTDPSAIVQQLQNLTDIEGDLADTAIAVMASTTIPDSQAADSAAATAAAVADDAQDSADAEDSLVENAEAMETVLESAIPPAPTPAATTLLERQETQSNPSFNEQAVISTIPDPTTTIAQETSQALAAVEADLNNPVLPAEISEPAHDVQAETEVEEDTSKIIVNVEEPTMENVVEAATNPENNIDIAASSAGDNRDGGTVAPASTPALPEQAQSASQIPHSSYVPSSTPRTDVPYPEGLSDSSPSVAANPDLIRAWQADRQNATILLSLFNWAVQKTEINDARAWHNALAVENPTAVQPLLALINLELALSNFPQVEGLFAKALKGPSGGITAAADVSIWKAYLHYIRRQNPITEATPNPDVVRNTINKAYEFALKECGFDRESGEIWDEYIKFVADTPAKNQWETQARDDNLRKLYQRAVCIPLNNVEALWKAYDGFESTLNKLTAKKFLAEHSPAYMTARTALRELRALTDSLPSPILPPKPMFSDSDRATVAAWKAYLKWEESNPLVIAEEEVLGSRIGYAMRKCLAEMRHFPELWHYASHYYIKSVKKDEAAAVLKAGVQACPKSYLLTFALAEIEEDRTNYAESHNLFNALIDHLAPEIDDLKKVIAQEVETARGPEIPGSNGGDVDMNGESSEIAKLVEERDARGKLVAERRGKEVEELQIGLSLVWNMYMRFARRAEGIKAARGVFGKSRKSPHVTWHTFEASAMMEYHSNKDSAVAIRIFELGFKLFSEDVDYVICYLQFLLSINDDNNARALFERSAVKIAPEKSRPLWDTWARYEYTYGDLAAVHKLEARFVEVFPNDSPLKRFAQRYTYNGIDQIALRDLGFGSLGQRSRAAPPSALPLTSQPSTSHGLPPVPPSAGLHSPGGYKRPAPHDSPRQGTRRVSVDHSRSPKRYRANSPPPPPPRGGGMGGNGGGRYPLPERDRQGSGRFNPPQGRDRSPLPLPPPPTSMGRRDDRSSLPPVHMGGPVVPPPAAGIERDRSGVGKPLVWFIGNLPTARAFDGPIFRPDDIIGLFNNISSAGTGIPIPPSAGGGYAPPPHGHGGRGYPEPDRRYSAPLPPPMRGGARY